MDSDGELKLSEMDQVNDEMDTDGAVATDISPCASNELESAVCDIIDNIIDAAVSSSVLENRVRDVGTDESSVNYHAACENQQDDLSSGDRPDCADTAETCVSACDDATNSKTVSADTVSALPENESDSSTSSSPSTSSTSSPDTDESDQFGGYTVNHVDGDSDDPERRGESTADAQGAGTESGHTRVSREERARRKRQRSFLRRSSSSDSPTTSSGSEVESDVEAKTSRLDMCEENFQLPADNWKLLSEVDERQFGRLRGRPRNPVIFTQHAGGSVALTNRLTLYAKHEVHEGCVNALHFNESGSLLASGSDDLKVVILDWIRSKTYISFDSGHRANVFQAKFLPHTGDCHIVTCARDGQVRLAQLSTTGTCKATKRLATHKMAAHKLSLVLGSPHIFYSCGEDGVVYQIDLRQEKPNKCYTTKENDRRISLYSIHTNPQNSYEHCLGGQDQYIRIYDVRKISDTDDNSALVKKFCPHHLLTSDFKAHVTCAVYNYNGSELIGTYNDEDIYLFDSSHSDGAEHKHKYSGHRNNATVKGVNFYGPQSEFIVSGSDCGNVYLWHRDSEKIVNFFHADDGGVVNVLEPHPHLPLLATSGLDSDVKLWMPTASQPANMSTLQRVTKKNAREREEERNEPEVIDSQMLWLLMHTLRRNAARRAASARGEGFVFGISDSDQSDDSPAGGNDDDDDGGRDADRSSRCTTS